MSKYKTLKVHFAVTQVGVSEALIVSRRGHYVLLASRHAISKIHTRVQASIPYTIDPIYRVYAYTMSKPSHLATLEHDACFECIKCL